MSGIKLIALVAMAMAQYPFLQADVAEGEAFVLDLGESKADEQARTVEYLTVTNAFARVAEDQSGLTEPAKPTATPQAQQPPTGGADPKVKADPKDKTEPKGEAEAKVDCRVLQACEYGSVNTIAQLSKAKVNNAKALGLVCDDKASVAYARSLQA